MTLPRGLALTIAIILLASAASTAHAGEYPVYACHPAVGDVNHSWVAEANHGGMTSYVTCPVPTSETRNWNRGLVTRHGLVPSNRNATIPTGSWAGLTFYAPPGTSLSRIAFIQDWCGWSYYRAGLTNAAGAWLLSSGTGWCGTTGITHTVNLGGTSLVRLQTRCVAGPCPVGGTNLRSYATLRTAIVWVADYSKPAVALTGGTALKGGWRRGTLDLTVGASDNVGIRSASYSLGGAPIGSSASNCTYTVRIPCPQFSERQPINTRSVDDGRRTLTFAAHDAAGNWSSASRFIYVDNTAPSSPLSLRVAGGGDWRARNAFALSWRNPRQSGTAPIAAVRTAICPLRTRPDSWTGCSYRSVARRHIAAVPNLIAPGEGEWVARVWLQDAAGNHDRRTAQTVAFRLDDSPPHVAFKSQDLDDPGRIDVIASDAISALRRTEVEYRRRGGRAWTPLTTTRTPTGFSARLDDEYLTDGFYDLRARAVDSAGNERSTNREASGELATRRVPIRVNTRLVAGQIKHRRAKRSKGRKHRRRRVIVVRPRVRYGRTVPIKGRLTTPGGNPVSNASIEVWQRISLPGASWRRVALIGTNGSGRFQFKALRGPSRTLRFRYPGTKVVRARTTEVDIEVQARTTLRPSRRRVVNGDEVVFRGRVLGRPLPPTGKLVKLQAYSRGRWLTFATPRADPDSGRWRHRYRFTATRGTVRYRFRAQVPTESGYPYARGVSKKVGVVVRGL